MIYASKRFWAATGERAVKTSAQAAIATIGAGQVVSAWSVEWVEVVGVALLSGVLSVLTSVASSGGRGGSGPSLGNLENLAEGADDD